MVSVKFGKFIKNGIGISMLFLKEEKSVLVFYLLYRMGIGKVMFKNWLESVQGESV